MRGCLSATRRCSTDAPSRTTRSRRKTPPIGLREIIKDLAKDVKDEDLKKRILAKVYRLTATN